MALTKAVDRTTGTFVLGDRRAVLFTITPDSAWLEAGESLSKADLGLVVVDLILFEQKAGYTFEYDDTNNKVLAYYGNYSESSDGALVAVPDDANISGIGAVRGIAIGR